MKHADRSLSQSLGEEVTAGMEEVAKLLQLASNRFAAGDYSEAWQYVRAVESVNSMIDNLGESDEVKEFVESVICEAGILPDTLQSDTQ